MLFDVATRKQTEISNALFPNAYEMTGARWRADSRAVTFEYNQRGHQAYRVIEIDASTGAARASSTKRRRRSSSTRRRSIASTSTTAPRRSGCRSATAGTISICTTARPAVKNQITQGPWLVRGVDNIDVATRQVCFRASGMYAGKDPYFIHYYRINLDGTGLTTFTQADANHAVRFSRRRPVLPRSLLARRPAAGAGAASHERSETRA